MQEYGVQNQRLVSAREARAEGAEVLTSAGCEECERRKHSRFGAVKVEKSTLRADSLLSPSGAGRKDGKLRGAPRGWWPRCLLTRQCCLLARHSSGASCESTGEQLLPCDRGAVTLLLCSGEG